MNIFDSLSYTYVTNWIGIYSILKLEIRGKKWGKYIKFIAVTKSEKWVVYYVRFFPRPY